MWAFIPLWLHFSHHKSIFRSRWRFTCQGSSKFQSSNNMNHIRKLHSRYLDNVLKSSRLDSNPYSTAPTVIFLSCTFVILYGHLHRYTFPSTKWKTRLYKVCKSRLTPQENVNIYWGIPNIFCFKNKIKCLHIA